MPRVLPVFIPKFACLAGRQAKSGIMSKWLFFLSLFCLASCATALKIQPQVTALTHSNNYTRAKALLDDNPNLYGKNNALMYLLDKGLVLHLSGDYKESIDVFDKAKVRFDELYTKSISGILSTWLINEYTASFRGEDFERVMITTFQALNYLMRNELDEALVEARDVDVTLSAINSRYAPKEKNVYKEDAFARLLMGILYEASGTREDINNAFISYVKAAETYENDYARNYNVGIPQILKENILAASQFMGLLEFNKYRQKYGGISFLSLQEKAQKAEVYLIHYKGSLPVKEESALFIPLPDGHVVKIAFPQYRRRVAKIGTSLFSAKNSAHEVFQTQAQLGEDISAIAIKNLENRRLRVRAKAIASAAGKYIVEKRQEENIRNRFGDTAADSFNVASNLFNLYSVKADLRSWQLLPSEICISRLLLMPGEYSFSLENKDAQGSHAEIVELGKIKILSGKKKFFLVRSL